jgi:1-acyl-sn-glycerol-3-phosphate acyltransferase
MESLLYKLFLSLRALVFWVVFVPSVILCALLLSLSIIFPIKFRIGILRAWIPTALFWLKFTCGLSYEIKGLENIPKTGFIVMSNHSSTWETFVLQSFLPPLVWVVKRELLFLPFFGWGLRAVNAIALKRGTGRQAIKQLISEGLERMKEGRTVMIFPEGTRVPPGEKRPYKMGGAILAEQTNFPILPIAHNAGNFWPRHSWIKWPGKITVVIGPVIEPEGKKAKQIIEEVEQWIAPKVEELNDHEQLARLGL